MPRFDTDPHYGPYNSIQSGATQHTSTSKVAYARYYILVWETPGYSATDGAVAVPLVLMDCMDLLANTAPTYEHKSTVAMSQRPKCEAIAMWYCCYATPVVSTVAARFILKRRGSA